VVGFIFLFKGKKKKMKGQIMTVASVVFCPGSSLLGWESRAVRGDLLSLKAGRVLPSTLTNL